jgi:hypothetical protein
MPLQARGPFTRAQPLLGQQLTITDAPDMRDEQADQRRDGARDGIARALEMGLAGGERSA